MEGIRCVLHTRPRAQPRVLAFRAAGHSLGTLAVDIGLQARHGRLRRGLIENDHIINAFQRSQDFDALISREERPSQSLSRHTPGVAVDAHHEGITAAAGGLQAAHVANMEEVETAIRPYNRFSPPAPPRPVEDVSPRTAFIGVRG